jgi:hypothetical protein
MLYQVTPNVFSNETRSNELSSQIIRRDRKSLIGKWVTRDTMKVELCKQIWEKTYMGQLEWARNQTTKMTQIRDSKSSPIKQQED